MIPQRFVYPSPGFEIYWNQGKGRKLLKEIEHIPTKEEIEEKIPLLFQWDELADRVIRDLYFTKSFHEASAIIDVILANGLNAVPDAPSSVVELFTEMETIPSWLNEEKLNTGSSFCRRTGVTGMIALRNYSLMGGYESAAINKPLIYTEALKKGAAKRIAETTDFWVNITGENALQRTEIGFKHLVKVRLMHAYARVAIKKHSDWDDSIWGVPINTWDMVATNLGFSIIYLDGCRAMGITPTSEEEEGLYHFWKYVGYLLGIPAELLSTSRKEAISEIYKWTITQPAADKDTQALAQALYQEPMSAIYLKFIWQRKMVRGINLAYNSFFLGKQTCETIGIPYSKWRFYPSIIQFFNSITNSFAMKFEGVRRRSAKRGRNSQLNIKKIMLKGFDSIMDSKSHR